MQATYTQSEHEAITDEFPEAARGLSQAGFFRTWSEQETGGKVWGETGYPRTSYRIHEGAGDEEGSMGFNHILWKRMYGRENSCESNRAYLLESGVINDDNTGRNINLYNPFNSLMAFLAGAADEDCIYSNGLYRAYEANQYAVAIPATQRPLRWCYKTGPGTSEGNSCVSGGGLQDFSDTEDAGLNLLGKATIAYNRGAATHLNSGSGLGQWNYFQFLQNPPHRNSRGEFVPTVFGYWLGIKDKSWQLRNEIGGYIPYVTYVWLGGQEPEQIPDLDEDGNIVVDGDGNPVMLPNPNDGQDWCFAYGERQWRQGGSYEDISQAASYNDEYGDPQVPMGRINCATGDVL